MTNDFKPQKGEFYIDLESFKPCGSRDVIGLEVEDEHLILENFAIGHNSSELIHEITKHKNIDENVFCINSSLDSRNSDEVIMTHDKITIPCCKVEKLKDAKIPKETQVIGIG